jgi:hypothetical protein
MNVRELFAKRTALENALHGVSDDVFVDDVAREVMKTQMTVLEMNNSRIVVCLINEIVTSSTKTVGKLVCYVQECPLLKFCSLEHLLGVSLSSQSYPMI